MALVQQASKMAGKREAGSLHTNVAASFEQQASKMAESRVQEKREAERRHAELIAAVNEQHTKPTPAEGVKLLIKKALWIIVPGVVVGVLGTWVCKYLGLL